MQARYPDSHATVYELLVSKFTVLQNQIQRSSNRLGIELGTEVAEIGKEDLGLNRLAKFRERARELDEKLTGEIIKFGAIGEEIASLLRHLQEGSPPEITELLLKQDYSERAFEGVTNRRDAVDTETSGIL
jgi:hypothetical protein